MREGIREVLIVSIDDPHKGGGVGGKHTHIRLLMQGLLSLHVEARVVTVEESASFRLLRRYPGAVKRRLSHSKDERFMSYLADYSTRLRRNLEGANLNCDVANPHDVPSMNAAAGVFSSKGMSLPTVLTLHGYFAREMVSVGELTEGSAEQSETLRMEAEAYKAADRIVCVDSRIRDYVVSEHDVSIDKTAVLPNAVDVRAFSPASSERVRRIRAELGVRERTRIILCPRRLVPKNGVDVAVRAMKYLSETQPDTVLLVVGSGPERARLEGDINDLTLTESVRLEGAIPHSKMLPYFQVADIVLIPSIRSEGVEEATSLSMLEGMACGKAVVVSDVGGLKETVTDGHNGIVVPHGDPESLAKACHDLLSNADLASSIGARAMEYVRTKHSHISHAERMLKEFEIASGR